MPMNENASRWIEELKSGKHRQARKSLKSMDCLCCLGVANEISALGSWGSDDCYYVEDVITCRDCDELTDDSGFCAHCGRENAGEEEFAHEKVAEWLGLVDTEGSLRIDGEKTTLAQLNDEGKSFEEIAEIILKHQDQLFVSDTEQSG